jgi:hypothetical protein
MPANGYIITALLQHQAPAYSAVELAALPAGELDSAALAIDAARARCSDLVGALRFWRESLPADAELIERRLRAVTDELAALSAALVAERERRQEGACPCARGTAGSPFTV